MNERKGRNLKVGKKNGKEAQRTISFKFVQKLKARIAQIVIGAIKTHVGGSKIVS